MHACRTVASLIWEMSLSCSWDGDQSWDEIHKSPTPLWVTSTDIWGEKKEGNLSSTQKISFIQSTTKNNSFPLSPHYLQQIKTNTFSELWVSSADFVWLSFMYEQTRAEALPLTAALCSSERHTASFCLPRREISKCSGTPEFFIGLTFSFTPLHLHICIEDWEITLRLWFALTLHISWGYLGLWRRVSNMENGLFFLTYLY